MGQAKIYYNPNKINKILFLYAIIKMKTQMKKQKLRNIFRNYKRNNKNYHILIKFHFR